MKPPQGNPATSQRRRCLVFAVSLLVALLFIETLFLIGNISSNGAYFGRDLKAENNLLELKISNLSKTLEAQNATIASLASEISKRDSNFLNISGYLQREDSQPYRLDRLSQRPEVEQAIQSEIFNSSMAANRWKPRVLPAEHPDFWRQHRFQVHGLYGFIQYSGYRAGPRTFAATGLNGKSLEAKRELEWCGWRGKDGSSQLGSLRLLVEGQPEVGKYESSVLLCDFENDTGTGGGHVVAKVDDEEFVMFVEDNTTMVSPPGSFQPNFEGPFEHELVFCSTCFHDSMVPQHVWEFLEFHRVIHKVERFFFYDGGAMDQSFRSKIEPYVSAGLVSVTDIREILLFSVLYWGQTLAVSDCLYRNRFTAKWIMMTDVDEYLQVSPGRTLHSTLSHPSYTNASFLTHGSYLWTTEYCAKQAGKGEGQGKEGENAQFLVERTLFRNRTAYCLVPEWKPEMCWDALGHRKLFVNPRRVNITQVHNVKNHPGEQHFEVGKEVWHAHLPGIGSGFEEHKICSKEIEGGRLKEVKKLEGFVMDESLAKLVPIVRRCPLGSKKDCVDKFIQQN